MNERLKDLYKSCRPKEALASQEQFNSDNILLGSEIEKFAQMIINECADICNKIYFDRYPDAEDFERSEEGDAIKKHFGVEE